MFMQKKNWTSTLVIALVVTNFSGQGKMQLNISRGFTKERRIVVLFVQSGSRIFSHICTRFINKERNTCVMNAEKYSIKVMISKFTLKEFICKKGPIPLNVGRLSVNSVNT